MDNIKCARTRAPSSPSGTNSLKLPNALDIKKYATKIEKLKRNKSDNANKTFDIKADAKPLDDFI